MNPLFELCIEGVDAAVAAEAAGIKRVELCAALVEGGITPSIGTIRACRDAVDIDIMVMIRPRGGDFLYSDAELTAMAKSIEACRRIGVTGVVFGLLRTDGSIDRQRTKLLLELSAGLSVTFHRAFDVSRDPFESMETLIGLGVDRILTSGQAATAPEGKDIIKQLIDKAGDRIRILPGCGITPENVAELINYTGAKEFHATATKLKESKMTFRNPNVYMGIPGLPAYERKVVSPEKIQRFLAAVKQS